MKKVREEIEVEKFKWLIKDMFRGYPNYRYFKIVENIIEAGRWAPSAHNSQPWKFIVIPSEKLIKNIQEIMLQKEKELLAGFNIVMKETAKCLNTAPLLIAVYSNGEMKSKFTRLGEPYAYIGQLYDIQSVSLAIENIMVYAHAIGVGSGCMGIALFCEKEINNLLNQKGNLIALLSLGFSDEMNLKGKRKPISEIVEFV